MALTCVTNYMVGVIVFFVLLIWRRDVNWIRDVMWMRDVICDGRVSEDQ